MKEPNRPPWMDKEIHDTWVSESVRGWPRIGTFVSFINYTGFAIDWLAEKSEVLDYVDAMETWLYEVTKR